VRSGGVRVATPPLVRTLGRGARIPLQTLRTSKYLCVWRWRASGGEYVQRTHDGFTLRSPQQPYRHPVSLGSQMQLRLDSAWMRSAWRTSTSFAWTQGAYRRRAHVQVKVWHPGHRCAGGHRDKGGYPLACSAACRFQVPVRSGLTQHGVPARMTLLPEHLLVRPRRQAIQRCSAAWSLVYFGCEHTQDTHPHCPNRPRADLRPRHPVPARSGARTPPAPSSLACAGRRRSSQRTRTTGLRKVNQASTLCRVRFVRAQTASRVLPSQQVPVPSVACTPHERRCACQRPRTSRRRTRRHRTYARRFTCPANALSGGYA